MLSVGRALARDAIAVLACRARRAAIIWVISSWMAYVSAGEVFVTSFPDRAGKVRISTAGGEQPRWGRDDRELYYLAADRKVMAVTLGQSHTLGHSIPVQLFDAIADHYAVTTDGRRFLLVIPTGDPPATRPFTVVVNWAGRLQK